ncbi:ATP-binding cassette domain-containing protein [bacterium]|nr:ATP-binding cassette domain-containing protein [bacterium]MBU4362222.1 ATP-binding cassette domain-containing protein [bacterium]MBU4601883.1 ATP-binding cassette domain-containing protein [bacterium]MDP2945468.1 ATP-binding cassette domain-containing protein [Atribacterota bacterium]
MSSNESNSNSKELLRMTGINKYFGKVHALEDIDFKINEAENVGLVGDNGAGKSTLIKIISGYHRAEKGQICFEGKKVRISSPKDSRALGIETVYQEQALAPDLSISRNIFMGREPATALGFLRKRVMDEESMDALKSMGLHLRSPNINISTLSGGERQGVAIARAFYFEAKLVILDEPTMALSVKEVREVFNFVNQLKRKGISVIFITHNLHQVFIISDRIVVLSHGKKLADIKKKDTNVDELSEIIVRGTIG